MKKKPKLPWGITSLVYAHPEPKSRKVKPKKKCEVFAHNLKCCGNCGKWKPFRHLCFWKSMLEVCDDWKYDGLKEEDRK